MARKWINDIETDIEESSESSESKKLENVRIPTSRKRRLHMPHMRRHSKQKDKNGSKKILDMVMFVVKHPYISLAILCILIILIVYLVYSVNTSLDDLINAYSSLTAKVDSSKTGFDKRCFYIKTNADGTTEVVIGYSSEEGEADALQASAEAGDPDPSTDPGDGGSGGGNYDSEFYWTLSSDEEKLYEAFKASGYSGKAKEFVVDYHVLVVDNGHTVEEAVGYMANCNGEGYIAVMQWGKYIENWNGDGQQGKSTGSSPLYMSTSTNISATRADLGSNSNSRAVGFGMHQWTAWGRLSGLLTLYENYIGSDNVLSTVEAMHAEADRLSLEINDAYYVRTTKSKMQSSPYTEGSAEAWSWGVTKAFEGLSSDATATDRATHATAIMGIVNDALSN